MSAETGVLTKAQKSATASILNQLRATAAVMCFDRCMNLNTMSTPEFQKRISNTYHGNVDLNIISQLDLIINGKGDYSNLYLNSEPLTLNENTEPSSEDPNTKTLVPCLNGHEDAIKYKMRVHVIKEIISSPVNTKFTKKCTGRFLYVISRRPW